MSDSSENSNQELNTDETKSGDKISNVDSSVENAIEAYRKIREDAIGELTEADIDKLDQECETIKTREIITHDSPHQPIEIINENRAAMGPPTLTRFEKARIMGARALQLSLGAPTFIEIPKNTISSLEIAMDELNLRLLPIVIKRSLPNGDYQNIPIDKFE